MGWKEEKGEEVEEKGWRWIRIGKLGENREKCIFIFRKVKKYYNFLE